MSANLCLAVFASGEGTTFDAIADAIEGGRLPAKIALLLADRPEARVLERARRRNIPTVVLPVRDTPETVWGSRVDRELAERKVELVVLAGFTSIVPSSWLSGWSGRVINLHPALLPKFGGRGLYGRRVHEAVLAAGETETGSTVHIVTDSVDAGPILAQRRVPIVRGDTPESLRARIGPVEKELLVSAIRRFSEGRWPLPYPTPDARRPPTEGSRRETDPA